MIGGDIWSRLSQSGTYQYSISTTGELDWVDIKVTSKPATGTQPIEVHCWHNSASESLDMASGYLTVYAKVTQGGYPILSSSEPMEIR